MSHRSSKTIHVDYIARVEGEGALTVEIEGEKIKEVKLKIFEPPRFFEALLRGRHFNEAADITARICGICPIAYQMSAVRAMEQALGIEVDGQLAALRRLIYCGEWIESHTLHIYMLHAPDFLGFPDIISLAKAHPKEVERGLRLKKAGNSLVALLGGRAIHPVNLRVGGFYKLPENQELALLKKELEWAREAAISTVRWVAGFDFPSFQKEYECLSITDGEQYPIDSGTVKTFEGKAFSPEEYEKYVQEIHVPHSNALQASLPGTGAFLTGPMARYNNSSSKLSEIVQETIQEIRFPPICLNPFQSIIVRSLEVLYAVDEALRIIHQYKKPPAPCLAAVPREAEGCACTEAPRGTLYHRYRIDHEGLIQDANIIPPTSQNQKQIEEDLQEYLQPFVHLDVDTLTPKCEAFIRNYDPCISCATHFLKLNLKRI